MIVNGALQAAAGSYLSTAIIAVASLFGPQAVQSMMFGQAAVAVAVSAVQVITSAGSVWGLPEESIAAWVSDGKAEERSALIFFALSTVFLLGSAVAHHSMVKSQLYRTIAASLEHQHVRSLSMSISSLDDETQGLVSSGRKESWTEQKARIKRVFKGNLTYEIGVAYVFLVTLVSRAAISFRNI